MPLRFHWRAALLAYLSLRLIASLWFAVVIALLPVAGANDLVPGDLKAVTSDSGPHDVLTAWFRWDTQWYTAIARDGYTREGATAFLPLYPMVIGGLGRVLDGEYLLAALIISNGAAIIALALLHLWVTEHCGARTAHRTLAYLVVFPTSFFFLAAYTESVFLALVLAAFVFAERGRWLLASGCGCLAILTRWQGAALIPALVWMYVRQR